MDREDSRFEAIQFDIERQARDLDAVLHNLRSRGATPEQRRGAIEAVLRKHVADIKLDLGEKALFIDELSRIKEEIESRERIFEKHKEAWLLSTEEEGRQEEVEGEWATKT